MFPTGSRSKKGQTAAPRTRGDVPGTSAFSARGLVCFPLPRGCSPVFHLLLADPNEGMNLRNDVLHDLVDCPSRHRIALVLQAALVLLRTIERQEPPEEEEVAVSGL
ncbi:hypothetical protein ACIQWL_39355 [Streptomyces mirabilis]|uniref:hypothetical protein n=1 Tax=Streptomyces mirabilis TaxID=68239 RepID=UPI0037F398D6